MAKKALSLNGSLIKTFGLFWKASNVYWPTVSGKLYGVRARARRKSFVNFRDQVGIYVLYADYKLVYIGQAGNGNAKLFDRLKHHYQKDDLVGRWNQFSWFGLKWVKANNELSADVMALHPGMNSILNHIEAILIHSSEPPLNRQGGRWGKSVQSFIQKRDEENLGPSDSAMLTSLYEQNEKEKQKAQKMREKKRNKKNSLKGNFQF